MILFERTVARNFVTYFVRSDIVRAQRDFSSYLERSDTVRAQRENFASYLERSDNVRAQRENFASYVVILFERSEKFFVVFRA